MGRQYKIGSFRSRMGGYGLNSSGSRYGPVVGSCKHCSEVVGSIKGG